MWHNRLTYSVHSLSSIGMYRSAMLLTMVAVTLFLHNSGSVLILECSTVWTPGCISNDFPTRKAVLHFSWTSRGWGRRRRRRVRKKQSQRKWGGEVLKRRSKDNRKWWWGVGELWISVFFWRVAAMSSHGSLVLEGRSATLPKEPRPGGTRRGERLALLSPRAFFLFLSSSGYILTPQITVAALNPPISEM